MNILKLTLSILFGLSSIAFYLFFIVQLAAIITGAKALTPLINGMPQELIDYTILAPVWFKAIIPIAGGAGIMGGALLLMRYPMSLPLLIFGAAAIILYVLIALLIFNEATLFGRLVTVGYTQVIVLSVLFSMIAWFVIPTQPA
ncbi:MAG: hypothetical protein AAF490_22575 [Chloroflexota bacterium]